MLATDQGRPSSHDDVAIALPAQSAVQSARRVAFINTSRLEGGLSGHASDAMQHKAMLVCGKTFETLLQDLQEKAVLKSSKQLSEAIQHLCFFDADPALLQTMVNLIVHGNIQSSDREGRVVLRLAHYFASSLPPPSTLANMQTKVVAKQVTHKQLNRRLIALRTLSVAASDSDVRTDLQKLIQSVLNGVEAQATAGTLSRKDAVSNACMQYASMAAIRQRPSQLLLDHGFLRSTQVRSGSTEHTASQLDRVILAGILRAAATCPDPVGARHAVALMVEAAADDPAAIADFMQSHNFYPLLTDPLAKVYFVKLCDGLAQNASLPPERREHFLQHLMGMTSRQTPDREFLQATQWLLRHHWPSLNAPQQQAIATRLEALIARAQGGGCNRPLLHATCRTIALVAQTLSTIPSGRDRQIEFQQMLQTSLIHRLREVATVADCPYVRGEVLKALVWLGTPTELDEVSQLIILELRGQVADRASPRLVSMPDSLGHQLLGCVCDRLTAATVRGELRHTSPHCHPWILFGAPFLTGVALVFCRLSLMAAAWELMLLQRQRL
jgi:hypothetical protein